MDEDIFATGFIIHEETWRGRADWPRSQRDMTARNYDRVRE
jgi:hypothetical protein